jgi:predicted transcriptional regulator of viral defense system
LARILQLRGLNCNNEGKIYNAESNSLGQARRESLVFVQQSERQVQAYVAAHSARVFPGAQIVRQNEMLPGGNIIDLHLRTGSGNDIFVEIKTTPIQSKDLSQLVDYYAAISNLDPPPKSFKMVLIGSTIDPLLKRQLRGLNAEFRSLKDIGFPRRQKHAHQLRPSPTEARVIVALESRKTKLVTLADLANLLGCSRSYAAILLHRLERKKWVDRISKGKYIFVPAAAGYDQRFPSLNPLLAGSTLISPYYYSYSTANAHFGLTTQLPATVYLATTAKKPPFLWKNTRFRFVTVAKRKFFGFAKVRVQAAEVSMAEIEKAIVDSVDKPRHSGGIEEVLRVVYRAYRRVDKSKLIDYALRMETYTVCQRLGFMLDFLAHKGLVEHLASNLRQKLLSGVGMTPTYIGPRRIGREYSRDWCVFNTLSEQQLLSEIQLP